MPKSGRYASAVEAESLHTDPDPVIPERGTLEGFALEAGGVEGLSLQSFDEGTVLNVITRHSNYRVVVLDAAQQRVLVTGGRMFPESTEVRFEGATAGGSAVKVGWIGVGLRLEFSLGRQRITTSRVHSVTVENVPPRRSSLLTS